MMTVNRKQAEEIAKRALDRDAPFDDREEIVFQDALMELGFLEGPTNEPARMLALEFLGLDVEIDAALRAYLEDGYPGSPEELNVVSVLQRAHARKEEIHDIIVQMNAMMHNASEASASPEPYNLEDFRAAEERFEEILEDLGIFVSEPLMSFPFEQWEEGLEGRDDDE